MAKVIAYRGNTKVEVLLVKGDKVTLKECKSEKVKEIKLDTFYKSYTVFEGDLLMVCETHNPYHKEEAK